MLKFNYQVQDFFSNSVLSIVASSSNLNTINFFKASDNNSYRAIPTLYRIDYSGHKPLIYIYQILHFPVKDNLFLADNAALSNTTIINWLFVRCA
jgi:hypothetical protein